MLLAPPTFLSNCATATPKLNNANHVWGLRQRRQELCFFGTAPPVDPNPAFTVTILGNPPLQLRQAFRETIKTQEIGASECPPLHFDRYPQLAGCGEFLRGPQSGISTER